MEITNRTHITAPVERVWALTVDVERWPELSPTMTSVERLDAGPLAPGSRARVTQPRQRPTVWTVTVFEPCRRFVWEARVGPVTMVASHLLTEVGDGCDNELTVEFSGLGSGLVRRLVGGKVREAITIENRGFKAVAEAATTPGDAS
jgi:uncharacterized membrane protein